MKAKYCGALLIIYPLKPLSHGHMFRHLATGSPVLVYSIVDARIGGKPGVTHDRHLATSTGIFVYILSLHQKRRRRRTSAYSAKWKKLCGLEQLSQYSVTYTEDTGVCGTQEIPIIQRRVWKDKYSSIWPRPWNRSRLFIYQRNDRDNWRLSQQSVI